MVLWHWKQLCRFFLAYISVVAGPLWACGCAFLLLCVCHHTMWSCENISFLLLWGQHFFCLYKRCCACVAALFSIWCTCHYAMWPWEIVSFFYCGGMLRFFCLYKSVVFVVVRFFCIMTCLFLCHVTMWKSFLLFIVRHATLFCLLKGYVVLGSLFLYYDMFCFYAMWPCEKVSFFSLWGMQRFFAYLRDMMCLVRFFCLYKVCSCAFFWHVTMWKSFLLFIMKHATLFCLLKGCVWSP